MPPHRVRKNHTITITITDNDADVFNLPCRIEVEDFDGSSGDEDIGACDDTGGGDYVYMIDTGEWLSYNINVPQSGNYDFTFRFKTCEVHSIHVEIDDVDVTGPISLGPATVQWESVTEQDVNLTAGNHVMKVVFAAGNWNWQDGINYMDITSP